MRYAAFDTMQNKPVGRNDPCPCGSGRKYKRCCLAEDERRAAEKRASIPQAEEQLPAALPSVGAHQIAEHLPALARKSSSGDKRAKFEEWMARARPILDYVKQRSAIEAAAQAIEAHRADFDQLIADQDAYLERTRALFAEDRFVPLRFTPDDVQRAFDKAGHPAPGSSSDEFVETVRKAILHLADADRRTQSAMSLLVHLPDYVTANRPLDAWILQECACLLQEERNQSNSFLFQMFSYGYDGWVAQLRNRETALLGQMGMDPSRLERMSMEEIDAWLQEQRADPAKLARVEEFMLANPEQRAQAEVNMEQLEQDALRLLDREDAVHLLLPPEDVQPWLPRLNELWTRGREQFPGVEEASPGDAAGEAMMALIFPLLGELMAELFTPERIRQLTAQLKTYRNARYAAGDKQTAAWANVAILSLGEGRDAGSSRFLYDLSFRSLIQALEV